MKSYFPICHCRVFITVTLLFESWVTAGQVGSMRSRASAVLGVAMGSIA